jgi:hypothetical protein
MESRGSKKQQETERYREAANLALDQLEWISTYLHRIGKSGTAQVLAKNRATIIEQLRTER